MKTNIFIDISPPIPYLTKFWFSSYEPKYCWLIALPDSLKYNISRMKGMMNFIFDMHINIDVFYNFVLLFWVYMAMHTQSTHNKKFECLCNIFKKTCGMRLISCLQINTKVFSKLIVSPWVFLCRHTKITQNNKLAISLQYLKENEKDEVDLLPADKPQRYLQIDIIILSVCRQACPNYPKQQVYYFVAVS